MTQRHYKIHFMMLPMCMLSTLRVIKSRRVRWAEHVAHMENKRGAYRVLVASPLGRPKCGWEDIIMDLQEVGWGGIGTDGGCL